jgi:hypothetical protein
MNSSNLWDSDFDLISTLCELKDIENKENEVHDANYANFQIDIPQINLWTFKKSEKQAENPEQPPPSNFET